MGVYKDSAGITWDFTVNGCMGAYRDFIGREHRR